jgi:hypothetical protein
MGWLAFAAIVSAPGAIVWLLWWTDERAWRRALDENDRERQRIEAMNVDRRKAGLLPIPGPGRLRRSV